MRKMKILILLLCASLAFAYMGCSNSSGGSDSGTSTPSGNNGNGNNGGGITPKFPTAISAGENGTAGTSGTYVYFGEWPQSQKAEGVTVNENESKTVGMYTYYKGSDDAWYAKVEANHFISSDTYYKVEPIKWRVLNPDATGSEKKMLLAEKILINCAYYDYGVDTELCDRIINRETIYSNNYEHSRVRAFLNGLSYQRKRGNSDQESIDEFKDKGFLYTAFTQNERAAIAVTSVENNERSASVAGHDNDYASVTPTEDKLFLLSVEEATKNEYGFEDWDNNSTGNARRREATPFARANGLRSNSHFGDCNWWLRSPAWEGSVLAKYVSGTGRAASYLSVEKNFSGVVPTLCLKQN